MVAEDDRQLMHLLEANSNVNPRWQRAAEGDPGQTPSEASSIQDAMALAIATDKGVGWIADAVLMNSKDLICHDQVDFACTAAREAVVSILNGGMYDDNMQLSHTDAPEPTLATRVGHPLPQLHHTTQGDCVVMAQDMSLAMHINGSSLSPAAIVGVASM